MRYQNLFFLLVCVSLFCSCSRPDGATSGAASLRDIALKTVSSKPEITAPFPADSLLAFTNNELIQIFGTANIVVKDISEFMENSSYHVVVLYPATEREAEIVLEDSSSTARVKAVILPGNSVWRTRAGVAPGMTLKEVQELNAKPFRFYGGGSDQGGYITNWNNGLLQGKIKACRLDRNHVMPYDLSKGDYETHEFSSDSEDAQKGNPVVEEITLAISN